MASKQANKGFTYKGKTYKVLPIGKLRIDEEYQRQLIQKAVTINSTDGVYAERAMRPITVSYRKDGWYYILDGQHRYEINLIRGELEVMCEIHTGLDQAAEAGLFTLLNNQRTVNSGAKFRAGVVHRDPTCLRIQEVVQGQGFNLCLVRGRPSTINNLRSTSALRKVYGWGENILRDTLRIIKGCYTIGSDGTIHPDALKDIFLLGFAFALFNDANMSADDVIRAMKEQEADELLKEVNSGTDLRRKDAMRDFAHHVSCKVKNYAKRR